MELKAKKEIIGASMFVVLSCIIWLLIPFQIAFIDNSRLNARFVPRVITMVMGIFSILNLALSLYKAFHGKAKKTVSEHFAIKRQGDPALLLIAFILYAFGMQFIGFEVASVLMCCLILLIVRSKNWKYYVISGVFSVLIGLVFRNVFYVPLP
jgi:hypothetical protein